ncbi:MAG: amino acid adenylation domain-containing protein, partial [Candidatus Omnitrophota bacterium]
VGLFGILKAGGAYLPIDPDFPQERIDYMLTDSGASNLITDRDVKEFRRGAPMCAPDAFQEKAGLGQTRGSAPTRVSQYSSALAYIIYTSGSTGKPKGVLTMHFNVTRVVKNTNYIDITPLDRLLQLSNYAFDGSVFDIYGALLNGASLVLIGKETGSSMDYLTREIGRHQITVFFVTTALFNALTDFEKESLKSIRRILFGGERVSVDHCQKALAFFGKGKIIHVYGPTETTVYATYYPVDSIADKAMNVPIGYPLSNTAIYLLNKYMNLVPVGVAGEIYIGGQGTARGYLNNPELTSEKFIGYRLPNAEYLNRSHTKSFCPAFYKKRDDGGILYKTGDLGKWLENGAIEFIGRIDHQVKLRGFRIELGEIEEKISRHPEVNDAIVLLKEDLGGDKYLCAYVVSDTRDDVERQLREFLSQSLPDYMIPSYFVRLDAFPLNSSGKINRAALPEPGTCNRETPYAAPRDQIDEQLIAIWSKVLGKKTNKVSDSGIGIDDNFFNLGGHSLKASRLVTQIHKEMNAKIPLSEVFKNPTIRSMSTYLTQASGDRYRSIEPTEEKEYYPVSRAQQRFYFLQQMAPTSTAYNLIQVLHPRMKIETEKLEATFKRLIDIHDSLRTSFSLLDNQLIQIIHPKPDIRTRFSIEIHDLSLNAVNRDQRSPRDIINRFVQPFDLAQAPLFRVGLIKTSDSRYVLLVDMHHIVSDGTSHHVLARDFLTLYSGKHLSSKRLQYSDYCQWQERLLQSGSMTSHETYWAQRLAAPLPEAIRLPVDYPATRGSQTFEGRSLNITLDNIMTHELHALTRCTGTTLYMVLLTVFNILLFKYTGKRDIIIGSPTAARSHADLENIIGLIIESLMMRNFPTGEKTFLKFLDEVKTCTLEAYEHQGYPYAELLNAIGLKHDTPSTMITNVGLMVQNIFDPKIMSMLGLEEDREPLTSNSDRENESYVHHTSKLDLTLVAWESKDTIFLAFEYSSRLFKPETIKQLAGHFIRILHETLKNPHVCLSDIDMITADEKRIMGGNYPCFSLSHPQKRIYYTEKVYPDTTSNNLAVTVRYPGQVLDKQLLEEAVNHILREQDGLRLRIVEFDKQLEPCQYVMPYRYYSIAVFDFRSSPEGSENAFRRWLDGELHTSFRILNNELFYFAFMLWNETESGFYMKMNHLVSDGWTVFLLARRINDVYRKLEQRKEIVTPEVYSYQRFISDEQAYLRSPRVLTDREFWHHTLLPLPEEVDLSTRGKRTSGSPDSRLKILAIPGHLRDAMRHYSRVHKASMFKLVLAALSVYISRVTGSTDFVIGSANHGRSTEYHQRTAGMTVSTFPLRMNLKPESCGFPKFSEFVSRISGQVNDILKNHQRYPFDCLMEEMREKTGVDINYFLNINLIGHPDLEEDGFHVHCWFCVHDPSPLTININSGNLDIHGILELFWIYQISRYSLEDIERHHRCLVHILDNAVTDPEKRLSEIELISHTEKEQLLYEFNKSSEIERTVNEFKPVHRQFEDQVHQTPDRIISVCGRFQVSYKELNREADALALKLKEKGIGEDMIVALTIDRSIEMIVGIFAILKSGGAYLPIDPSYPQERMDYMLKDSGALILITERDLKEFCRGASAYAPDVSLEPIEIGQTHGSAPTLDSPCEGHENSTSLAYIIYTSGSTGKPKGVAVDHRNLSAYIDAFDREFHFTESDVVLQQASFSFDTFGEELYPIVLKGGKLAIPFKDELRDLDLLSEFIQKHRVTVIDCSPLMLEQLNELPDTGCVHTFISGGDVLKKEYIGELIKKARVYNTYGPTETTICAAYYRCSDNGADSINGTDNETDHGTDSVLIGKPIAGYAIYIMDRYGHLQPVGLPGELCVAGNGVTRGYLNRPELTFETFSGCWLPVASNLFHNKTNLNPSQNKSFWSHLFSKRWAAGGRLYKTGDLACWLPDGNIAFLGRIDQQVKIRGFRIEPGEIRSLILEQSDIKDAIIIAVENQNDKYLCAYILPVDIQHSIDTTELKKKLSHRLPAYMVPAFFMIIPQIPLTVNGKIDFHALPVPGAESENSKNSSLVPQRRIEKRLAAIWSDILSIGKDAIHSDSNFFDLGGHSLKATLMLSRIQRELNIKISFEDVFVHPTLRELAHCIERSAKDYLTPIAPVEEKEYYPLSSAQKRLYIIHQLDPQSTHYNIPSVIALEGTLDISRIDGAFRSLVQRHDSFRTSFCEINDVPMQRIHRDAPFVVEYFELIKPETATSHEAPLTVKTIIDRFIRPFKLFRSPLLRVGIIKTTENGYILMADMHHIISDGFSIDIFIGEFVRVYSNRELPRLHLQYKDYVSWQIREQKGWVFGKREEYWVQMFEGKIPKLNLPADYPTPSSMSFEGKRHLFEIGKELTLNIKACAKKTGTTLNQFLLAVFTILLSRYTRNEDIVVGCPVSGRTHADLYPVIGMFVNMLAMRNRPEGHKPFRQFLAEVKHHALDAYENQDYPFEELIVKLKLQGDSTGNPLFDAAFALNTVEPNAERDVIKATPIAFDKKASIFDITLQVEEYPERFAMSFEYKTAIFKPSTMEKYAGRYIAILEQVVGNPDILLKDIAVTHQLLSLKKDIFKEEGKEFRF